MRTEGKNYPRIYTKGHEKVGGVVMMVVLLGLLVGPVAEAQFLTSMDPDVQQGGKMLVFKGTVLGTATLTSKTFSLGNFDGLDWATYPVHSARYMNVHLAADTLASYRLVIDGSNDGTRWFAVDTLTSTAAVGDTTRGAATYATFDLNNKKFVYYRARAVGLANNVGAYFEHYLFFPKFE